MFRSSSFACITVACLAAGCTNDPVAILSAKSEPQPASVVEPAQDTATAVPIGPGMQRLVDLAKADLHERSGVATDDMAVIKADYVTWRNASVGCPAPGDQYAQVLTPGSRIHLRVDGKLYRYHSGGNRAPFLCERPSGKEPLPYAHGET